MINILKNIFLNNGYDVQDAFSEINQIGFIGSISRLNKRDYYFVIDVDINTVKDYSIDKIIDKIVENYWNINLLKRYNVESDYKKNTSLIISVKVDSVFDEYKLSNKIYDIEESPYFFKRYIILYTEQQKELIQNIKSSQYISILSDKEKFRAYKKNKKGEDNVNDRFENDVLIYDIISKLYIKIPFLVYNFDEDERLPILADRINKALDSNQKKIRDNLIDIDIESDNYYELFNDILDNPTEEEIEEKYNDILTEIASENE